MTHFKLAYLKLTGVYVLIVIIISVGFSLSLYRISSDEIDRGLLRQTRTFGNLAPFKGQQSIPEIDQIRKQQLDESNARLKTNLIYFNILILILSAIASYFFAKRTLEPIEEAMESQSRFTADASHELRTPLTAMKSEIEVSLRDKKMSLNSAIKLLKSNLEEIGKLESLSTSLLKLTRSQNETQENFEEVSLEDVLTESYEKIESLAQKKDIKFETKLIEIKARGDKQSLVELFVIFLDNAIKFSPKKSKIFITMKKEKHFAIISIKDQGSGIKALDLPHIFDRFYCANSSRNKEKVNGYGLGLAIAKQIVDLHDGEIMVQSKPDKGSTFSVKLPI
ncbi:TPA: sensor histidine kinase [Candidatus Berkelbacteria bacterium]|uniref:histidine kinase n=1 Tax=Berkelbacteria bacterium GW2011_GWE1_39_12 TaxID=1618337 RepID=A0A0G4B4W5_9BACT|nr:MAG: putative Histidine kinase [Berkelbacteria bacterium GW2011_GWE1_39_12]HBO60268.1 sensor histidine kinase [Candidatus Berkelbacteria bacterium]